MALLIPDVKCLVLQHEIFSLSGKQYVAGYHPGPVAPSATDPAPLVDFSLSQNATFS